MSTSYYRLIEPITSIRLEEGKGHDRLTVFENGANCGTLTFSKGVGKRIVQVFALYEEDNECPMRTHWGGDAGAVVTENVPNLSSEQTLISEYGDILTVKQIRARHGAGPKDGFPTELFGYEDK